MDFDSAAYRIKLIVIPLLLLQPHASSGMICSSKLCSSNVRLETIHRTICNFLCLGTLFDDYCMTPIGPGKGQLSVRQQSPAVAILPYRSETSV